MPGPDGTAGTALAELRRLLVQIRAEGGDDASQLLQDKLATKAMAENPEMLMEMIRSGELHIGAQGRAGSEPRSNKKRRMSD